MAHSFLNNPFKNNGNFGYLNNLIHIGNRKAFISLVQLISFQMASVVIFGIFWGWEIIAFDIQSFTS